MQEHHPPKIELNDGVMGPFALLSKGRQNFVSAMPKQLLMSPMLFGRMVWKGYAVSGADEVKHVLARNPGNYPRSRVVKSLVGPPIQDSFFCADEQTHRWQRRAILGSYSKSKSLRHAAHLPAFLNELAAALPKEERFVFDAEEYIERFTLYSSLKSNCCTYTPRNPDALRRDLRVYSRKALRVSLAEILNLPPLLRNIFRPFVKKNLFAFRRDLKAEIRKRRADPLTRYDDLLQTLLDLEDPVTGKPMDERQVLGNTSMMIIAAHEPTANILSWVVYLLAAHPEIQRRAREEILAIPQEDISRTLHETPYLHAVIYETLRLYSVGPVLLRDCVEDDAIMGCPFDSKSFVFVAPYALHRSPIYWEDPDAFMPDRFLSDTYASHAYVPFSAGPRSCVGKDFAMTEMLVFVADFLRRFEFSALPEKTPRPKAIMSVYPEGGVWIDVTYCR